MEYSGIISQGSPLVIAHRGASAIAPENTLAAFARALADGADGLELDVRLARDGVPIVIHDSTLRRTGRCAGVVSELTSGELGRIDIGSWFNRAHPKLAQAKYSREVIPTLEQVFSVCQAQSRTQHALIYVEMKTEPVSKRDSELARSVVRLINNCDLQSRVVVVSFNLIALAQVKAFEPSIRTGALFEPKRSAAKSISGRRLIAAAIDCGANEILLHRLIASRRLIDLAATEGLRSVVWTVDDPKWLRRVASRGIHAIITNNSAAMMFRAPASIGL